VGPDRASGSISLEFGNEVEEATGIAIAAACEALAEQADPHPVRLAPNVFVVEPQGFEQGDEITVTSTVSAEVVRQDPESYDGAPTGDLQVGSAPGDYPLETAEEFGDRLADIRVNRDLPEDTVSDGIWVERILAGTHTVGDARTAISAKAFHWSPAAFGACFVGEKDEPGELSGLEAFVHDGNDPGLFGPVLMPICSDDTGAPCMEQPTATEDGAVEVVSRIPAEDPWMM